MPSRATAVVSPTQRPSWQSQTEWKHERRRLKTGSTKRHTITIQLTSARDNPNLLI